MIWEQERHCPMNMGLCLGAEGGRGPGFNPNTFFLT